MQSVDVVDCTNLKTNNCSLLWHVVVLTAFTIAFTFLVTWACRLILDYAFGLNLLHEFWLRDFLGNLLIAFLCLALVQRLGRALLLTAIVVIGFQLANGGKLSVLGTPISPDDFINVQNLFYLTDGWKRIALMIIAALPVIAAVLLTPFRRVSTWAVMVAMATSTLMIVRYSEPLQVALDQQFGNSVWNQPENFKKRGLALHIAQETVRTLAKVGKYPDQSSVLAALGQTSSDSTTTTERINTTNTTNTATEQTATSQTARNVHIVVLESFFDPVTLGPEWVPEDPLPASFRSLWEQTGQSKALSPVFGGYTANAEFETLCGFPVTENAVFFEGWLRRDVPCLPNVLAQAGYSTIASHPNVPGFWNRTLAYNLVGFDHYLSKTDFDLTDSVGGLLLDHSYYDQVFKQLDTLTDNKPILNYMLTYHGHLPYPTNDQYPDKIQSGRNAPLLHGYLNQIWYKSRDLMSRLQTLRANDPSAIIVIFGDHLPFLGPNYGVYSDVLNLPDDRADFTGEMLEYLVSTPLIVIDGERGPVELGKLPIYRLPALILALLDDDKHERIFDWTRNPKDTLIRPVYGMHINVTANGAQACPDDLSAPPDCKDSASWLARTRLLISDVFTGKQFSLRQLQGST